MDAPNRANGAAPRDVAAPLAGGASASLVGEALAPAGTDVGEDPEPEVRMGVADSGLELDAVLIELLSLEAPLVGLAEGVLDAPLDAVLLADALCELDFVVSSKMA